MADAYLGLCEHMFSVDKATADAIRRVWNEQGELPAIVELQRHFPGITDQANARRCVHTIVGWARLPDSDQAAE